MRKKLLQFLVTLDFFLPHKNPGLCSIQIFFFLQIVVYQFLHEYSIGNILIK